MASAILQKDSKQAAASVSAALDIEGNMPLTSVQLDSLVVLKIAKHCRESYPSDVTGQLLGLDVNGILDVTHCFPFPSDDDEEANAQYQLDMMRCLREVNVDNNTVGWYRSANMGNFLDLNLIDTQYNYQHSLSAKSIVIIHDVSKSASQGNLNLRAFRLTDNFMRLYATKKYTTEAFAKAKLSFSTIFEELPLTVHNSYLATALLQELDTPAANQTLPSLASFSKDDESAQVQSILTPNFDILDLELDPFLEKNLDDLLDCSEAQHQEQNNWQYWQRSVGREQAKIQQYIQKKKQENLNRVAQHLDPIPDPTEHELAALFKLPPEPSRLESMVLNAQMHHFCKQLNQFAGPSLGRLFAVQELQK